ncbi:Intraflagellar transport complex B protein 46 C terminal family protein [Leishmania donovani]|uniref:Intraflagellar transport complex B protein 46 C terminal family protein n=1 Tax=Leishmania donovani TaxID=5661 RepID=A0A504XDT4_LEIDO|nr:Intraflagellar transport complex B protein 46 C terminal family protein [Leishmania donovani]
MGHASDESGSASVYDESTETTEEEASESGSESSRQSGDDLPIPVPDHPQESPVAVIPTRDRIDSALSPSTINADNSSESRNTGHGHPLESLAALRMENTAASAVLGGQLMVNNPNDERIEVRNAENVKTPRTSLGPSYAPEADASRGGGGMGQPIENAPHDEAIPGYAGQKPTELAEAAPVMQVGDPQLGYNPAKYARINATASREMQDLFKQIMEYEPFAAELPAKLRPFVPDYIPTVGDLDPFVKVPRPDGIPDGLGLEIVDEPAIPQSNPAVVLLELNATNAHGVAADIVDSLENAANRPEVIDRWISDIKKVHYKKALPTVNYQRPMPDIETLMQVWPQQFEEVLNSDVAFPPSQINLDLDQYVRTLCAILDIPTYSSLIDSLHVMFTLYEEFRSNQHFQHV